MGPRTKMAILAILGQNLKSKKVICVSLPDFVSKNVVGRHPNVHPSAGNDLFFTPGSTTTFLGQNVGAQTVLASMHPSRRHVLTLTKNVTTQTPK